LVQDKYLLLFTKTKVSGGVENYQALFYGLSPVVITAAGGKCGCADWLANGLRNSNIGGVTVYLRQLGIQLPL
jgi:hypothetical protein